MSKTPKCIRIEPSILERIEALRQTAPKEAQGYIMLPTIVNEGAKKELDRLEKLYKK